jgi:hypothetical protein
VFGVAHNGSFHPLFIDGANWFAFAVGVCNNPAPVSAVVGIRGDSRYNKASCLVTLIFQVRKHLVEAHRDVSSNIFSNNPSRPDSLDNSKHFRPEVSVIFIASSDPGKREGLAGVSPDNDVNQSSKSICVIR